MIIKTDHDVKSMCRNIEPKRNQTLNIIPHNSSIDDLDSKTERLTTKLINPEHKKKAESLINVRSRSSLS